MSDAGGFSLSFSCVSRSFATLSLDQLKVRSPGSPLPGSAAGWPSWSPLPGSAEGLAPRVPSPWISWELAPGSPLPGSAGGLAPRVPSPWISWRFGPQGPLSLDQLLGAAGRAHRCAERTTGPLLAERAVYGERNES